MLKTVANLHVQGIFSRLHLRYSIRYLHELRMDAKNSPEKIPVPPWKQKNSGYSYQLLVAVVYGVSRCGLLNI